MSSISGSVVFDRTQPVVALQRGGDMPTWPQAWSHGPFDLAIDGYIVWPERILSGRTPAEQAEVGAALTGSPLSFVRSVKGGCFNIVIHDHQSRVTRIITDWLAVIPLFVRRTGKAVYFASDFVELRRISGPPGELDWVGLTELYDLGNPVGDRTVYKDVSLVSPGSILTIDWASGAERMERWEVPTEDEARERSQVDPVLEELVHLMRQAVARLKLADGPQGIKLSAGMDSRSIAATWSGEPLRSYTFGFPASTEVKLASRLAKALGFPHRVVPIDGDFFDGFYAQTFERFGFIDFFHQSLIPAMMKDGCRTVFDGLLGEKVVGGEMMKRWGSWKHMAMASFGIAHTPQSALPTNEAMAQFYVRQHRYSDHLWPVLTPEAKAEIEAHRPAMLEDLAAIFERHRPGATSLEQLYGRVRVHDRSRRNTSLQGAFCRPQVESLYPFLDVDLRRFCASLSPRLIAHKRLYVELYSKYFPAIRGIPGIMSGLPYWVPTWMHYPGRDLRYVLDQVGSRLSWLPSAVRLATRKDSNQWSEWIRQPGGVADSALGFVASSTVLDHAAAKAALSRVRQENLPLTGTRLMLTTSFSAHFRSPAVAMETDRDHPVTTSLSRAPRAAGGSAR
jgi:hypothetical protein